MLLSSVFPTRQIRSAKGASTRGRCSAGAPAGVMMDAAQAWRLSASSAVAQLKAGILTPLQLIQVCRQRVEETDGALNAVPEDLRGWQQAEQQAAELMAQGWPLSPEQATERPPWFLYGLPIMVKDLTAVQGLKYTCGSRLYKDRVAGQDDALVTALKAAGAVVVAKTNTPEFGAGAQTWNDVYGTTRNPFDTRLTPGGSSGGSTAALAAGQVWLATGTDVGGSLRIPASFCGVLGLRPTPGLVPHDGTPATAGPEVQPGALYNLAGPMARTAQDLALFLDAMTQGGGTAAPAPAVDAGSGMSSSSSSRGVGRFTAAVQPGAWASACRSLNPAGAQTSQPLTLAYSEDLGLGPQLAPVDPEVADICAQGAQRLAAVLGARLVSGASPDVHDVVPVFRVLRAHRLKGMGFMLEDPGASLIKEEMLGEVRRGTTQPPEVVEQATAAHAAYCDRFLTFLATHQLLATPCVLTPPFDASTKWLKHGPKGHSFEEYTDWLILTYATSLVPCPALSLPVGFTAAGLPVGLQLVARPGADDALLAAAAEYERVHPQSMEAVPLAQPRVGQ